MPLNSEYLEPWVRWVGHPTLVSQKDGKRYENTQSYVSGVEIVTLDPDNFVDICGISEDEDDAAAEAICEDAAITYAERIRLCINACQGIPNECLEAHAATLRKEVANA